MGVPIEVDPEERLGRGVFSERAARRAPRRIADIVLPDTAAEDREEQKQHAQELADAATWLDRSAHASQEIPTG